MRIFCTAWMSVFVVDCDGWRLDVCQVSVWEVHGDENGIVGRIVERIVGEVVGVVRWRDDGWWIVQARQLEGVVAE